MDGSVNVDALVKAARHQLIHEEVGRILDAAETKQAKRDMPSIPLAEKKTFKGPPHEPASKDKPGEGGRFQALKKKLSKRSDAQVAAALRKLAAAVRDPGALAAAIGRKKYGKKRFQQMAAAGKKSSVERDQLLKVAANFFVVMKHGSVEQKEFAKRAAAVSPGILSKLIGAISRTGGRTLSGAGRLAGAAGLKGVGEALGTAGFRGMTYPAGSAGAKELLASLYRRGAIPALATGAGMLGAGALAAPILTRPLARYYLGTGERA